MACKLQGQKTTNTKVNLLDAIIPAKIIMNLSHQFNPTPSTLSLLLLQTHLVLLRFRSVLLREGKRCSGCSSVYLGLSGSRQVSFSGRLFSLWPDPPQKKIG